MFVFSGQSGAKMTNSLFQFNFREKTYDFLIVFYLTTRPDLNFELKGGPEYLLKKYCVVLHHLQHVATAILWSLLIDTYTFLVELLMLLYQMIYTVLI